MTLNWKRANKTEITYKRNRAIWLVYRTDTKMCVAFGWLSEHSGDKTLCPRTFYKSIDTSLWRHTATRLANLTMPSPYKGFLSRENEEAMLWSFHPLAHKTNNEHLLNEFFKIIRKSLYLEEYMRERHKRGDARASFPAPLRLLAWARFTAHWWTTCSQVV